MEDGRIQLRMVHPPQLFHVMRQYTERPASDLGFQPYLTIHFTSEKRETAKMGGMNVARMLMVESPLLLQRSSCALTTHSPAAAVVPSTAPQSCP